ncbi:MAG TPA: TonB-dependent receptor [Gemmatimonadales bacterium]|nr:TonB-dependent receptor [Gemmatimonadales bacterium]
MMPRVMSAASRFLVLCSVLTLAIGAVTSPLAAQAVTGKVEGTVSDQAGAPVANAQVFVVGTSFGAVTNDKGYYFINNVPVGTYTVRAQFIGYAPAEVRNVRVQGGQTVTTDVKMQSSAVVLTGITIETAANPIVPRDQVTSKSIVSGQTIERLPVNDVREALRLEPGVVESGNSKGLVIRGGRPGEAAVFVDGVLVRNSQMGQTNLTLGVNALEEASVTTGAVGAEFGEAQSGVFAFVTKTGGQRYQGNVSLSTDQVGELWRNVGQHRIEASFGGPVAKDITFFLGGTATGNQSGTCAGLNGCGDIQLDRDLERPVYVASGVDTVVNQPVDFGDPLSDTITVEIPRFVQYSGYCGNSPYGSSQLKQDISSNYGVECQGLRLPLSANTLVTGNASLLWTYGTGSRVRLSGAMSTNQWRNTPTIDLYNSANQTGSRLTNSTWTLNWNQNLARSAERAMALDVYASYQQDRGITGVLTRQSELDSRDPTGGFMLSPLKFLVDFNSTHDVTIAGTTYNGVHWLDDQQISCLQAGQAACTDLAPFLDRNDLISAQPYRMNPYAAEQSARLPMFTSGVDNGFTLIKENRWQFRANFDWQADRYNRVKLGGEYHTFDTRRYASGMISAFGLNGYAEKPSRMGMYFEDRLDLGDVVLVGGLRFDRVDSKSSFPIVPGRISSITESEVTIDGVTYPLAPFDPLNPTANFVVAPAHTAWSPSVQVSFPVTEHSNFRLSYAHQVQAPDFDLMYRGKNTDLSQSNRNQSYGRDLDFAKTIIFEFGIRHAFNQDMVLDVSAYNKDKVADVSGRLFRISDPGNSGTLADWRVFNNADFGNVRGLDFRLDRRFSNIFSGSAAYTFQIAKSTGSDPFAYFRTTARVISSLTNETAPPPQATLPTDDNRKHQVTGAMALQFPTDWHKGTTLGSIVRDVGMFATFRFASGLPYTKIRNSGEGVAQGEAPLEFTNQEPINSSYMPWFKNVDLRVTKGFRFGTLDWTLFGEAKNLFNWRNVLNLFLETGDVVNAQHRAKYVDEQTAQIETEAQENHVFTTVDGENAVDLSSPGVCTGWASRTANGAGGPVDCVLLQRAEARFGNGDGVYTASEYGAAFNAWYNLQQAPDRFYGAGRRIRVGAEISF